MGIIAYISDTYTLAQVMRVNHFFFELAETSLYHKVILNADDAVAKFSQSVSCCDRCALLVHELHLSATSKLDPRMPYCFKSILSAIHNVQHLTLVASAPQHWYVGEPSLHIDQILRIAPLPALRTLTTSYKFNDFLPTIQAWRSFT